jgi:hypothetical protein
MSTSTSNLTAAGVTAAYLRDLTRRPASITMPEPRRDRRAASGVAPRLRVRSPRASSAAGGRLAAQARDHRRRELNRGARI